MFPSANNNHNYYILQGRGSETGGDHVTPKDSAGYNYTQKLYLSEHFKLPLTENWPEKNISSSFNSLPPAVTAFSYSPNFVCSRPYLPLLTRSTPQVRADPDFESFHSPSKALSVISTYNICIWIIQNASEPRSYICTECMYIMQSQMGSQNLKKMEFH